MLNLSKIPMGKTVKVVDIKNKSEPFNFRIMEMGIVPDVKIKVEKIAPFGDPIQISVLNYHLAIRKADASNILVEVCEN